LSPAPDDSLAGGTVIAGQPCEPRTHDLASGHAMRFSSLFPILSLFASCASFDQAAQQTPPQETRRSYGPEPRAELGVSVSDDASWLTYSEPLDAPGEYSVSVFTNDDDDFVASVRVLRYGSPRSAQPWTLGLGLGIETWFVGEPSSQIYAVVLVGHAAYDFGTSFPTRCRLDVTYAPDATTFHDGEHLIDVMAGFQGDVSSFATAFVGYRMMEVSLDNNIDAELQDGAYAGIRLGF